METALYIHVYTYMHTDRGVYAHVYVSFFACFFAVVHVCVHISTYMYACMYVWNYAYHRKLGLDQRDPPRNCVWTAGFTCAGFGATRGNNVGCRAVWQARTLSSRLTLYCTKAHKSCSPATAHRHLRPSQALNRALLGSQCGAMIANQQKP